MNRFVLAQLQRLTGLCLVLGLTFYAHADFKPSQVRLTGYVNLKPGDGFLAVFGTPEGVRYAKVRVHAPYRPASYGEQLLLLRGKVWGHRLSLRPIAGSIIGKKLRLEFVGSPRRGRIFELSNKNLSFSLKRASPFTKLPCGVSSAKVAKSYKANNETLPSKIGIRTMSLPFSPTMQLDIATEGDDALYAAWGANTNSEIQDVVNTAATVYLSQLGIVLNVSDQHYFTSDDPFTSTDSADILTTFQNYTLSNHQLSSSADAFMLFSGLDFDDSIVGLAYVGAICADGGDYSFGIVQRVSSTIQSIVFAHELGHNFGADHDNTTQSIMSPYVSAENTSFSTTSISEMDSHLTSFNSCLTQGDPTLSLRLSNRLSTASRRLKLTVTPSGKSAAGCVVKVNGAASSSALESAAQEITGIELSAFTNSKTSEKLRKRRRSKQLVFQAIATCEDGTVTSNVSRLRADLKIGTRLGASEYLNYLAKKFP